MLVLLPGRRLLLGSASAWAARSRLALSEVALSFRPLHYPHPTDLAPGGERRVFVGKLPDALGRQTNPAANLGKAHKFFGHGGNYRRNSCVMTRNPAIANP
jgi:hypothetical protein